MSGWYATDGSAEIYFPGAESGEEAAREYVAGGDWGDSAQTAWVRVWAWQRDEDGEDGERESYTVALDPDEPECDGDEHDWSEDDVQGHGGGVVIRERCVACGLERTTDTWAQCPETGEQGLRSVEYGSPDAQEEGWGWR